MKVGVSPSRAPSGTSWEKPFGPTLVGWGCSADAQDPPPSNAIGGGSVLSHGEIIVTLHWQSNFGKPAPSTVVLAETGYAQWSGGGVLAENDLGDDQVVSGGSGVSNGTHYRVLANVTDGYSYTVHPYVLAESGSDLERLERIENLTSQPNDFGVGRSTIPTSAEINYNVTITPVEVVLDNTIPQADDSYDNVLIGQGVTGHLQAPGYTQSNHSWTIPGDTFANFEIASDQSFARVTLLGDSDYHLASPHWYWWRGHKEYRTVSCSATLSVNGQEVANVTASRIARVWEPSFFFDHSRPNKVAFYGDEDGDGAYDKIQTENPNNGEPAIRFDAAVDTPFLFSSAEGYGSWLYVQLCNISRANSAFGSPLFSTVSTNGEFWLDNDFGYLPEPRWSTWDADSTSSRRSKHEATDAPDSGFVPMEDEFKHHDSFKMYVIFKPPGEDSKFVPLFEKHWEWSAAAAKSILDPWPVDPVNVVPGSSVLLTFDSYAEFPPQWEHVFHNVDSNPPPPRRIQ